MDSELRLLDEDLPAVAKIIREEMALEKTREGKEDMFGRLWGTCTVTRVLIKEFRSLPPSTTG